MVKLKIRKYVFAYFQFHHFLKSKMDFKSSFKMRRSIFLFKKKNWSVLTNNKKIENWIYHCIFKSFAEGLRVFFLHARAPIFSPNALYLPTKQPWGAPIYQNTLLLASCESLDDLSQWMTHGETLVPKRWTFCECMSVSIKYMNILHIPNLFHGHNCKKKTGNLQKWYLQLFLPL